MAVLDWASNRPFGAAHLIQMPVAAQFVLSFLLMDLTFYWWHVANHRIPFLWRFHNVHHIDPDLDVSTAFRFHFGEVALSAGFRVAQVSAIGLSGWMFAVYELVFQANTVFHHSNVRLPIRLERLLNLVLVTPRMHGIHHSQVRDETNSRESGSGPRRSSVSLASARPALIRDASACSTCAHSFIGAASRRRAGACAERRSRCRRKADRTGPGRRSVPRPQAPRSCRSSSAAPGPSGRPGWSSEESSG